MLARGSAARCAVYALVIALALLAHVLTTPHLTGVQMHEGAGPWKGIELPFSASSTGRGTLEFRAHVRATLFGLRPIVVVPDDHFESLEIDGVNVPLSGIPPAKLTDWKSGFTLSISRFVHPGDNVIVARVHNEGGPGGLDLHADPYDWMTVLEIVAGMGALLAFGGELLRRHRVPWPTIVVVLAAIAVRWAYLAVTPFDVRHHDVFEHIAYIEYVLQHHAQPNPEAGYMFYQPPLYYALCAAQWAALRAMGAARPAILWSLQVQSVLAELGFAFSSIAAVRMWMRRVPDAGFGRGLASEQGSEALLAALILFWPSSIVHAVRIGNDDLAYLFFGTSFYFTSRWWVHGAKRDVVWASLLAALGVITKVNDLVAFAVLGLAILGRLVVIERERRIGQYVRRLWVAAVCLAGSVAAALGTAFREWIAGRRAHLLASNANHNSPLLAVGNHAKNYLWFDAPNFLTHPFTSAWDDSSGRQWFWNYLLKTSLFGEFDYASPWLRCVATVISGLVLVLLVQLIAGLLLVRRRQWLDEMPLVLAGMLWVVSLAELRHGYPLACSNDFRYIVPVIVPCAYAYVRAQTRARERGWRAVAGASAIVGWLFVLSCAAFFCVLAFVDA